MSKEKQSKEVFGATVQLQMSGRVKSSTSWYPGISPSETTRTREKQPTGQWVKKNRKSYFSELIGTQIQRTHRQVTLAIAQVSFSQLTYLLHVC